MVLLRFELLIYLLMLDQVSALPPCLDRIVPLSCNILRYLLYSSADLLSDISPSLLLCSPASEYLINNPTNVIQCLLDKSY